MGLLERADSLVNAVTSVGTRDDPAEHRRPKGQPALDMDELDDWFLHGRFTPAVVERPVEDALRSGRGGNDEDDEAPSDEPFHVKVDGERPFQNRLDALDVRAKIREALVRARETGGAGIVLICDDQSPLDKPIDWRTFSEVTTLRVFDRWELHPDDYVDDISSEHYGQPKSYYFHPDKPGQTRDRNGEPVGDQIHHSRVIPLVGREVRSGLEDEYDGWGQPIPDLLQEHLKDLNAGTQAISSSLDEFQYDVVFIDGLLDMVSGFEGGEEGGPLADLFDAIGKAKSYLNAVILPGERSALEKRTIDYGSLVEAIGILKENLSLASHIPLSILFGQTPQGLSSNDETGRDNYYDWVQGAIRERKIEPALAGLVYVLTRETATSVEPPVSYGIRWSQLDETTEAEQAEIEAKEAKSLQGDVKLGVLSPREAKKKRHPELVRDRGDVSYENLEADRRRVQDARPNNDPAVEASDLQPEKQRKGDVGYVNSSPGEETCADCGWYDSQTGTCGIVRGEIAETGWCRLWNTKVFAGASDDGEEQ